MKPQTIANVLAATLLGIFAALLLVHWVLTSNVVTA